MAAPGFADGADVEALIAYISTELIPQRVAALAAERPRRIFTRSADLGVSALVHPLTGFTALPGDQGDGTGIPYVSGVFTIANSGIYRVSVNAIVSAGNTVDRTAYMFVRLNGGTTPVVNATTTLRSAPAGSPIGSTTNPLDVSGLVSLQAGDEITLGIDASASVTFNVRRYSIERVA